MADRVEQIMQEMVPELDDLARKRIFDKDEVRQIVIRRRNFEYQLVRPKKKPADFLAYVRYEVAVECLRRRRNKALHWKTKSVSDYAGIRRLHFIFSRGVIRFRSNLPFWYQYIDFCLRSGSTKILSRVMLKALKYHPKETHLWLLAADRELKYGNIKAARALLLRGIRGLPRAPALWAEFMKLEVQVAQRQQAAKQLSGTMDDVAGAFGNEGKTLSAEVPTTPAPSPDAAWAPARLLLRRALGRLGEHPRDLVQFCTAASRCIQGVCADAATREGSDEFVSEVRRAIADRLPGAGAPLPTDNEEAEIAATMWELWWQQEIEQGHSWNTVVKAVASSAPPLVVQRCAVSVSEAATAGKTGSPGKALLYLAASLQFADTDTALAVLGALERYAGSQDPGVDQTRTKAVYKKVLESSVKRSSDISLQLLAWRHLPTGERDKAAGRPSAILKSARDLTSEDASRLLTLVMLEEPKKIDTAFGAAMSAIKAEDAQPGLVVSVFLARAQAQGSRELQAACNVVADVAGKMWDKPAVRADILAAALSAELRACTPAAGTAKQVSSRFEALLECINDSDPRKIDWWVRYAEFVQRAARYGCGDEVPSGTDLNRRAMRSVSDQALLAERAHHFLDVAT